MPNPTTPIKSDSLSITSVLQEIGVSSIYLMGGSFLLGCFFTLMLLLLLDFIRSRHLEHARERDK